MSRHISFIVSVGVAGVFFVNVCALVFGCGCRSLWSGLAEYCNIHAAVGPHCPWCEHPLTFGGIAFGATLVAQWAACYLPRDASFFRRLVLGLIAFAVTSGVVAVVQGLVAGYWAR